MTAPARPTALVVCAACGADVQRASGCSLCRDPGVLAALGVRRRRFRVLAWSLAALAVLVLATAGADQQEHVGVPVRVADDGPHGIDVVARPGDASVVDFTAPPRRDEAAAPDEADAGSEGGAWGDALHGVRWENALPPTVLLAVLVARAVRAASRPRPLRDVPGAGGPTGSGARGEADAGP